MVTLEKENILFLNQAIDYIRDSSDDNFLETGIKIDPTRIELRPGHKLILTATGYNIGLNLQGPLPCQLEWKVPQINARWKNSDITLFSYLLSLAPLQFDSPLDPSQPYPLPSEFISVLVKQYGNGNGITEDVEKELVNLVKNIALRFRRADSNITSELGGGYHARTLVNRYRAFSEEDLVNRERILAWRELPRVNNEITKLIPPSDSDAKGYQDLTCRQSGFVTPSQAVPNQDYNALIRAADTQIRVLNPEIEVPIFYNANKVYQNVDTSIKDIEQDFGLDVFSIVRPVSKAYIKALMKKSDAVREEGGDGLKNIGLFPAYDDEAPENTEYLLPLRFAKLDDLEPDIQRLNIILPKENDNKEEKLRNVIKEALLIAANDRITFD